MGRDWLGETCVFSHALRLYSNPFTTKSIALETESLAEAEMLSISEILKIPLQGVWTIADAIARYGNPIKTYEFTGDRKTYVFFLGKNPDYEIGLTILNEGGLVYFTMETFDVADNKELILAARNSGSP